MNQLRALQSRVDSQSAVVGIVGMGYVGLPLAVVFAEAGFSVRCIDLDSGRVDAINRGQSYIEDITSERLAALVAQGRMLATTDFDTLREVDGISICVPTPLSKTFDPDLSYIISATEEVAQRLRPGHVVVLESTTYPGTTREVILSRFEQTGLKVGEDYFLAFSPERVDPGRSDWTTVNTPKVLGGVTEACLAAASAIYGAAIQRIVPVSSPEAAEMVKLLENTFRSVNIGLVNEVQQACDKLGLDAWEIIDAAATKPFGFMRFTPGPGLGGHCIPIDPLYLSWKLKTLQFNARFIELASEVNAEMPRYWVQKVQDALNEAGKPIKGSRIVVLGIAYKRDVSDARESPAIDIVGLLEAKGAVIAYHDPFIPTVAIEGKHYASITDLETAIAGSDCVVVATDHSSYEWGRIEELAPLIVDTRGVYRTQVATEAGRRLEVVA